MAYCNLHDDILDNDWYMSLPDNQKVVWIHLMALASKEQGTIRLTSIRLLAGRIGVTQHSLRCLIASAQHRLSIEAGVSITFTDWSQWNVKRDISKDRVRSYREKKRVTKPLRNDQCNGHVTLTEEEEEKNRVRKDKVEESNTVSSPFHLNFKTEWNKLSSDYPILPKIARIGTDLEKHLTAREKDKDPPFDPVQVCDAIRKLCRAGRFPSSKGWKPAAKWITDNNVNYTSILADAEALPKEQEPTIDPYSLPHTDPQSHYHADWLRLQGKHPMQLKQGLGKIYLEEVNANDRDYFRKLGFE
jgi:hypothetical protein